MLTIVRADHCAQGPALLALASIGVCLVLGVSPARAATIVSGDRDTNAPLVIDPSVGASGARTFARPVAGSFAFIQRMPVTKRVTRVTLGDLGRDPASCDTELRLYVREHPRIPATPAMSGAPMWRTRPRSPTAPGTRRCRTRRASSAGASRRPPSARVAATASTSAPRTSSAPLRVKPPGATTHPMSTADPQRVLRVRDLSQMDNRCSGGCGTRTV